MRKSQKTAVVGASVIAIVGGGIAFAAWTSTGTGTGTATAGQQVDLTVARVADVTGLYPTGFQNISFNVTNNNPYAVQVSEVAPSVTAVSGSGCTVANSLVTAARQTPVDNVIAAGGSSTYVVKVSMGADSDNACQSKAFTISATATAASASAPAA